MLSSPRFPHPPTQRLTQNTSERKKMRPCAADGTTTQDSHRDIVPLTSSYRLQSSCHPAGLPQSTALFLQSSRTAEEESQQHISVIQATGSAAGNSPLAQSHREASPLPSRSSPNPISFSPKHFSHSPSPQHSSVSSSPKPLALCSPSKSLSLCSSPLSLSSLPKPPTNPPDERSVHLNSFKLKQVSYICYSHCFIKVDVLSFFQPEVQITNYCNEA